MVQGTTLRETLLDSEYLTDEPSAYAIGQAASKLEKIQMIQRISMPLELNFITMLSCIGWRKHFEYLTVPCMCLYHLMNMAPAS